MARHYFKELRLQQFRALLEVARRGSFTAAADALKLSRTSVWQQLRSLEDEFGAEFVAVRENQPRLTDEGRLLSEMVAPLIDGFDGVKPAFLERVGRLKRRLVVATTTSLLNHELREPVAEYRRHHRDVTLNLIDRPSSAALELLRNGEADLAVIGRIEKLPGGAELQARKLARYPFVFACPKNHSLAKQKTPRLAEIVKHPLVLPSHGTNARERINRVLTDEGLLDTIQLALDSNSATLLLKYIEQDLGVGLTSLSPELARDFEKRVVLKDMSKLFGEEEIVLVERVRRFPLKHVAQFVETVARGVRE